MQVSLVLKALVLLKVCSTAFAAVHQYNNDYFYTVADAFIFRGGREGLFASSPKVLEITLAPSLRRVFPMVKGVLYRP